MSIASSKPAANRSVLETVENGIQDKGTLEQGTLDGKYLRVYANQAGEVDLSTPVAPLVDYLRSHEQWIEPCFKPLKVTPLTPKSYQLKFFRMGALGFELEPCFGIEIGSKGDRLFFLHSIPLLGDDDLPYSVDCSSEFRLEERQEKAAAITRVFWTLDRYRSRVASLPKGAAAQARAIGREALVNEVARRMCNRLSQNICQDYYRWQENSKAA